MLRLIISLLYVRHDPDTWPVVVPFVTSPCESTRLREIRQDDYG